MSTCECCKRRWRSRDGHAHPRGGPGHGEEDVERDAQRVGHVDVPVADGVRYQCIRLRTQGGRSRSVIPCCVPFLPTPISQRGLQLLPSIRQLVSFACASHASAAEHTDEFPYVQGGQHLEGRVRVVRVGLRARGELAGHVGLDLLPDLHDLPQPPREHACSAHSARQQLPASACLPLGRPAHRQALFIHELFEPACVYFLLPHSFPDV